MIKNLFTQIFKSSLKNFRDYFITITIFGLILSGGFYYVLGSGAREALIGLMFTRIQSISTAGAQSMGGFLKLYANSLVILTQHTDISTMEDSDKQKLLDDFTKSWKDTPADEAIFVDRNGNPKAVSPAIPTGNANLSDREYFKWAVTAKKGDFFIGEPIIARFGKYEGQYIIPIASPVTSDGQFGGVLASAISIPKLAESYLLPLKFSDSMRIYLINSKGTLLYAPTAKLIGVNYIDYLKAHPFLGSEIIEGWLKQRAEGTSPGKLDIVLPNEQKGGLLTRFLIAHTPVFYGNSHWLLAVAIPADEALGLIAPVYVNQLGFLLAAFLSILLLTMGVLEYRRHRNNKIIQTEKTSNSDSKTE